jgi:lipoprotein-releasing system ATP-binding protein
MFIEVDNLKKSYGQTEVLRGLNFSLEKSQELAIIGQSGSGKSTLLYIMGALETTGSGTIKIDGEDLTKLNDEELANFRNNKIGFVFQFHFLLPSMNCLDNTLLPAKIGGHKLKLIKERVIKFSKILKVEHCLKRFPFELSGGEQQRINIIRAISLNPSLLLCDEPTGNLDSENSKIVLDLLRGVADEIDSTLVMVTHDSNISDSFERKITIVDGQIIG